MKTALIVEDDFLIAMELEDILGEMGFEVQGTSPTEDEAVTDALIGRPDLMLVDYRLAAGTGLGAIARLAGTFTPAVVFVSANIEEILRQRPSAVCVSKPFDKRQIMSAVSSVLD
ncbi:response regulator [Rhizobium sp. SIMBA_035]